MKTSLPGLVAVFGVLISASGARAQGVQLLHAFTAPQPVNPTFLIESSDGNLYGVSQQGGGSSGSIYKLTPAGSLTVLHAFTAAEGGTATSFTLSSDGNFYGTTCGCAGSSTGGAIIFRLTPAGAFTILRSGGFFLGSIVRANDGTLYGTSDNGGFGTVFKLTADGSFSNVHTFTGTADGTGPNSLVLGADGNFYGTTGLGGSSDAGVVFRMSPQGTVTVLHAFTGGSDGSDPGKVVMGADGSLYGTTKFGGISTFGGTLFRIAPDNTFTTLHSFPGIAEPSGALIQATDGNFYGSTQAGASVFKTTPGGVVTTLHTLTSDEGQSPAAILQSSDGSLYGTGNSGGQFGAGTVFRLTLAGATTVIKSFNAGPEGANPVAGLIQASDGNFYGTTSQGGASNTGTVFRMTPQGGFTTLHEFRKSSASEGLTPVAALIQAIDGALYGTTQSGGSSFGGVIFRVTLDGTFSVLHSFTATDGTGPTAPLIQARDGNFYGTANSGGPALPFGVGTVFKMTPSGTFTVVHAFSIVDFVGGEHPETGLVEGADGSLYGTTLFGTIFKITTEGVFTLLVPSKPDKSSALLQASDGNFYGTAVGAFTANNGSVFSMTPLGTLSTLHTFTGSPDGAIPGAAVVQGVSGNLYGTTAAGGSGNLGTVFRTSLSGTTTVLHSFSGSSVDGAAPVASLVRANNGQMYGTASAGGNGAGVVFAVTCGTIALSPMRLPSGLVGVAYPATAVVAQGGVGTTTLSTIGGLPDGISMFPSGQLSGTPAKAGLFRFSVTATDSDGCSASRGYSITVTTTPPAAALDRTALAFGATTSGSSFSAQTGGQTVHISQSGAGDFSWSVSSAPPWLVLSPSSGTGSAALTVSVQFAAGVPASGQTSGTLALSFSGTTNPNASVNVTLTTVASGASANPFGSFDSPLDNSTGVTGSIAVTGWALDDLEIVRVRVFRQPVGGEATQAVPTTTGMLSLVFIGNAVLVEGSRTDVAALIPTAPRNMRAGWGYLLLTNVLPNSGNGTFVLHAIVDDADGHSVDLGTKTITCANGTSVKPFGAVDTPGQGEVVSGSSFANFGWVLARGTVGTAPPDGGTVTVFIDGVPLGSPIGWVSRADLTSLFPATTFPNVAHALGVFPVDTTVLPDGVHTIFWIVTATNGQADGIGSRFFTVANGSGLSFDPNSMSAVSSGNRSVSVDAPPRMGAIRTGPPSQRPTFGVSLEDEVTAAPPMYGAISGRRGYDLDAPWRALSVSTEGARATLYGEEMDRFELQLWDGASAERPRYTGYLRNGSALAPLPIGSHLDQATGMFTWTPGPGFLNQYDLVFVHWSDDQAIARQEARIVIAPKTSNRLGPQVTIDTPRANQVVGQPFVVAGWAIDRDSAYETGVETLHVWAYPLADRDHPMFLGATAYGGSRPDLAATFGERFKHSGFGITVDTLPAGTYDIAVFAWSTATGGFVPAKVVRVTVR